MMEWTRNLFNDNNEFLRNGKIEYITRYMMSIADIILWSFISYIACTKSNSTEECKTMMINVPKLFPLYG